MTPRGQIAELQGSCQEGLTTGLTTGKFPAGGSGKVVKFRILQPENQTTFGCIPKGFSGGNWDPIKQVAIRKLGLYVGFMQVDEVSGSVPVLNCLGRHEAIPPHLCGY